MLSIMHRERIHDSFYLDSRDYPFCAVYFLLYCCVRVSAVSNKVVEQLKENQKQMDTDAEKQDEQTKEAGFQNRNDNK